MNSNRKDNDIFGKMLIVITMICFALFACSVDSIFDSGFTQTMGVVTAVLTCVCLLTQRNRRWDEDEGVDNDDE